MKRHEDSLNDAPVKRPASAFTEQIRWMVRQVMGRFMQEPPQPPEEPGESAFEAR
jgi:hypothetical protein